MRIQVVDSHTGGEPTRVVLEGGIDLRGETMAERRDDLAARFGGLCRGIVDEPRGSEAWVGAALTPPVSEGAACGVVFFNPAGPLGMCGHGTIGLVETLRHLGRLGPGEAAFDTPAGRVMATLRPDGEVAVANMRSYRHIEGVALAVEGVGEVRGDVSYGGNWFFLAHEPRFEISMGRVAELTEVCARIRRALAREGVTGEGGAEIDHVELFSPAEPSTNFVRCPGGAYDRSPCGTGTSARLAGLFEDGLLMEGEEIVQRSVTGSLFRGSVEPVEGGVRPTIVGRAWVTAESTLVFAEDDPLRFGMAR